MRATILNGNPHQRAPVGSASTQNKDATRQQQSTKTTAAMLRMMVRLFLMAGTGVETGAAGTLPT